MFNDPLTRKTISTINENNELHAAPTGSLMCTPDGSNLFFSEGSAVETPKNLKYMKETGKIAVVVFQKVVPEEKIMWGYSVRCKVGDRLTSGQLYDKAAERSIKLFGTRPKSVWMLIPISYKVHTPGPDKQKIVIL